LTKRGWQVGRRKKRKDHSLVSYEGLIRRLEEGGAVREEHTTKRNVFGGQRDIKGEEAPPRGSCRSPGK